MDDGRLWLDEAERQFLAYSLAVDDLWPASEAQSVLLREVSGGEVAGGPRLRATLLAMALRGGEEEMPLAVRYRIRDQSGEVVERQTSVARDSIRARYYHSLAPADQHFADEIVILVQRASAYFSAPDDEYEPLDGVAEMRLTDEEVRARIARLEQSENTREAEREKKQFYPASELPFEQQRAPIEQIEALKQQWQFEILGEVEMLAASA